MTWVAEPPSVKLEPMSTHEDPSHPWTCHVPCVSLFCWYQVNSSMHTPLSPKSNSKRAPDTASLFKKNGTPV